MSRSRDPLISGIAYAERAEGPLLLDLRLPPAPAADADIPLVVWLHGGGWFTGDRSLAPDLAARAAATGFAYASIEYRLSGSARFPAQLHDVRAAIRFLKRNASRWGLDPERIGLWGASAGGHLAALAGVTGGIARFPGEEADAETGSDTASVDASVRAVAAGYPPVDLLGVVADARAARPDADPAGFPESRLLGAVPDEAPELAATASPLSFVSAAAPAFQLAHGTADPLVHHRQSVALHEALVAAGADAEIFLLTGYRHGFLNPSGRLDVALRSVMDDGRLDAEGEADAEYRDRTGGPARPARFGFAAVDRFFRTHLG
ncbi:alpha/beta hydrolase [Leucobacter allii]|uniref:Alpha/beta hydrolase n=1 Tax=Leucobacter allii TaxID=2932247 RepID=A0ABY4FMD2_9MICO|nr:alpha/beta hydrolase [Leucobacter allii]UOQ57421.1 alpha/beta hydrolase [Leucobacter allii]